MPKSRILFISPNQDAARSLGRILDEISLPLDVASDFQEARSLARKSAYSLLVTEITLPDGAWNDVLDLARRLESYPPVIVTSLHADARFWVEAVDAGAADVVRQPFDRPEVQRVLAAALRDRPQPVTA